MENTWRPTANLTNNPMFLYHAHAARYPHEHSWVDATVIGRSRLFLPQAIPSTTISGVRRAGPRDETHIYHATNWTNPFNTSAPKIDPRMVLYKPPNPRQVVPY